MTICLARLINVNIESFYTQINSIKMRCFRLFLGVDIYIYIAFCIRQSLYSDFFSRLMRNSIFIVKFFFSKCKYYFLLWHSLIVMHRLFLSVLMRIIIFLIDFYYEMRIKYLRNYICILQSINLTTKNIYLFYNKLLQEFILYSMFFLCLRLNSVSSTLIIRHFEKNI